jgi:hypothetical protein
MNENRGPWYLLTGLVLGLIIGLVYSWAVRPVEYVNTSPASLRADFKDQYRALIAAAYAANGDLVRARGRLSLLQDADTYQTLAAQAQQTLAEGNSSEEARALGLLAVAIGQGASQPQSPDLATSASSSPNGAPSVTAGQVLTATQDTTFTIPTATSTMVAALTSTLSQTISNTSLVSETIGSITNQVTDTPASTRTAVPSSVPAATGTLLPTRTPTATPGAPYILQDQQKLCDPDLEKPLIEVIALDAAGSQVPGVEAVATWPGGEQLFYTGLKPELGVGYADIEMTVGITYTLRLAGAGESVSDLAAFECEGSGGERYWGSWLLTFIQP